MEQVRINKNILSDIANAIRTKNETSIKYNPSEMADAILNIEGGSVTVEGKAFAIEKSIELQEEWKFKLISITHNTINETIPQDFDDFETVRIPHDWSIYQDFNQNSLAQGAAGWLDGGDAWYVKTFPVSFSDFDKKFILSFDGVYQECKVYINDVLVKENHFGYNPFDIDISDQIIFGSENTIKVFVTNDTPSSRWYSGSGIYRNVTLHIGYQVENTLDNITVTYPELSTTYTDSVNTVFTFDTIGNNKLGKVKIDVYNDELLVATNTDDIIFNNEKQSITVSVNTPKLWTAGNSNLYTAKITLYTHDGNFVLNDVTYGYRWITYDNQGFYINGEKIFIKGVCMHHDLGILGSESNREGYLRQIKSLENMGCNAIRTSHNPASKEFLDLCMERGILVQSEFFDTWSKAKDNGNNIPNKDFSRYFLTEYADVIKTTLKRDINNPAIVMWSVGNEIIRTNNLSQEKACEIVNNLVNTIKEFDTTRPVTMGDDTPTNAVSLAVMEYLDIIGVNYGNNTEYTTVRNRFPDKCIYGSETTSHTATRGYYQTIKDDTNHLYNDKVNWGETHATVLNIHQRTNLGLAGMFVWTGWDYLGEPTPVPGFRWPGKSSFFGICDLAGFEKEYYWLYRSHWNVSEYTCKLQKPWQSYDYEDYSEESIGRTLKAYSNCDTTEWYFNGEALPVSNTTQGTLAKQPVNNAESYSYKTSFFKPGTLVVNGYKGNELVAQDVSYTAKAPARIKLTSDKVSIQKDKNNILFVVAEIVDENGVTVPGSNNTITVTCHGGEVIGTDNGYGCNTTKMRTNTKAAYDGKLLAMIRPDNTSEGITVIATANNLLYGTLNVTAGENIYAESTSDFIDATNPTIYDYDIVINNIVYKLTEPFTLNNTSKTIDELKLTAGSTKDWSIVTSFKFNGETNGAVLMSFGDFKLTINKTQARLQTQFDSGSTQLTEFMINQPEQLCQMLVTHKYLNGSHRIVMQQLDNGKMTSANYILTGSSDASAVFGGSGLMINVLQLQTFDRIITVDEAISILPEVQDFTVNNNNNNNNNNNIELGKTSFYVLDSVTPELAKPRMIFNANCYVGESGTETENDIISIHNENIKNLSSEITSKSVGETVIRFVYNNIIKKVNITVTESEIINPSDPTEVYSLNDTPHIVVPNNANTVIDTNTKILNSNSSFTVFIDFEGDPALQGNSLAQPTLIHCMRETNPWPGLVCHYESNGLYMIWYKAENDGSKPHNIKLLNTSEFATRNSLALVHTENTNTVDVYFNGTFVKKLSCGTYIPPFDINKPCIIGANMDDGKSYRRYFNGTIWRAKIYNEVKPADFILKLHNVASSEQYPLTSIQINSVNIVRVNNPVVFTTTILPAHANNYELVWNVESGVGTINSSTGEFISTEIGENTIKVTDTVSNISNTYTFTVEDTNELYSVTDYECTGSNGIDTGIKFFEYDNISAECTVTGVPDTQVNNATLIGIIDESGSPWPGIALNNNNDTLQKYKFAGYRVRTIDILMSDENEHTFKITKLGKTLKLYADGVNVDNVTITDEKLEQCKASSINVYFGYAGEYLYNGNPIGRYWKGNIKSASVYIEDITAFTQEQSDESNSEEFVE